MYDNMRGMNPINNTHKANTIAISFVTSLAMSRGDVVVIGDGDVFIVVLWNGATGRTFMLGELVSNVLCLTSFETHPVNPNNNNNIYFI
jgi:hypothetical protein